MRSLATGLLIFVAASVASARTVDLSSLPPKLRELLVKDEPAIAKKNYALDGIDALLRKLQTDPAVEEARAVDGPNGSAKLLVRLARQIGHVSFKGLQHMNEGTARAVWNIEKGETYHNDRIQDAGARLQQAYKDLGVLNPVIEVETPEVLPGVVDLDVTVKEGAQTLIHSWLVDSPNADLNKRLEKGLANKFDGPYTDNKAQDALKYVKDELRAHGHLRAQVLGPETKVIADEKDADLTFRLDHVESYTVDFRGNKDKSAWKLEDDVLNLKEFTTTNPNVGAELSEKIRQAYLQRGFARVEVTPEELEGRLPFSRKIIFNINEGPRILLDRVEIRGRVSRPGEYYEKFIRRNSTPLVRDGFYNRDDLEVGFKNLALELQNQGYLVAKVVSTRTGYNRDRTKINLYVNIDEGPLTVVDSVMFQGNNTIPSDELQKLLAFQPGQPLRLSEIEQSIATLKSYYQDHGYIEMQILNEKEPVSYNEDNTRARLVYKIQEGPQVRVASILLDGNTFTKDQIVMNELDFKQGDLLTPTRIEESVARLQRTGYFGQVEVRTLEEKTAIAERTVIVRVTERNPGVLTIGAGATNENDLTLRGYMGVSYVNLFGTGRGVSARVELNDIVKIPFLESKVVLGYLEPYLFNTRNRGRVNLTRSKTMLDTDTTYTEELNQVTYSVERDFTSHVTGIWDIYNIGTYKNSYLDRTKAGSNPDSLLDLASTILHLDLDYRDSPFNPTKGTLSKFSVEYSSPKIGSHGADEYWRETASVTDYWGFGAPGWVWINSLRGGYLNSVEGGRHGGVPYDKVGFILGGRTTLRGYEAGTNDVFPNTGDLGGTDQYKLTTAAEMALVKSEIDFPLYGALGGAFFYDGGFVQIDGLPFADYYRDAAGFGLHYNTPVGPLNLEFAWKLDRRAGEEPMRFHLSIGTF